MGRSPTEESGLKKGPWTPEEDQKLLDYIPKHGHGSWRTLPKNAGLQRCGKSCRLRWTNYLRPDIKRGRFSFEEEETIIQLHSILGNKWSAIAARLPGRTDNEIKNYWNTHIRKRLLRMGIDPVTHSPRLDLLDISSVLSSSLYNSSQFDISSLLGVHEPVLNSELLRLATTLLSSQRENPQLFLQNLQENKLCNPQLQNHFSTFQPNQLQSTPIQEFTSCTNSSPVCAPFLSETHLVQANGEQFPSNSADFGCQKSPPNVWQENGVASDLTENFIPTPNYGNYGYDQQPIMEHLSENSTFGSIHNSHQNFSFGSVLSTPSSSPTPLNSSSTYVNCSTEDKRDSYCSNLLKFEIPNILGVNEFM